MAGWLKRLVGAAEPAVAPAHNPAARNSAAPGAAPVAAAPLPPASAALRLPLVSALGGVAGFEFRLADAMQERLRLRHDPVAQAAHAIALLTAMRPTIQANRVALATLPPDALARDSVQKQVAGAHLLLDPFPASPPEAWPDTALLRRCGAHVGRVVDAASDTGADAFVVLRRGPAEFDAFARQVARTRTQHPQQRVFVTEIGDLEDLERVLALDVALASAPRQPGKVATQAAVPRPAVAHICQVLGQLGEQQHASDVARRLGADVTLSYRLLRCVNSPAFGLSRAVASIEEAVLLVGHAGLHRWLCIALLASADGRKVSRALQEVSLARARLFESLAARAGDAPQALFTLGLLSLLDVLLRRPLAEALEPLHLSGDALDALLHARGPWADYLALARNLEAGELDSAAACAQRFGGLDAVLPLAADAWQWAADVTRALEA